MAVGKADDVGTVGGDIVVGDCVLAEVATEDIGVVTLTALEMVVTSTAFKDIVAVIGKQAVVSCSAEQGIVAVAAIQAVSAVAAVQDIVAAEAAQRVVAFIAEKDIVSGTTPQGVIALTAGHFTAVAKGVKSVVAVGILADQFFNVFDIQAAAVGKFDAVDVMAGCGVADKIIVYGNAAAAVFGGDV